MKKIVVVLIFLLVFSGNVFAESQEKSLNMLIDIKPYIDLKVGEDINISVDQPWEGGEIREVTSKLHLKTNTDVELSWESTSLKNEKTGRSLPLGITTEFIERLFRGGTVKAADQPFGLNTFLVEKRSIRTDNSGRKIKTKGNSILSSVVKEEEILKSSQVYRLEPGLYDFDIIVQYYWSKESNWSQIIAGEYKGEIIYTVSAVNDGKE